MIASCVARSAHLSPTCAIDVHFSRCYTLLLHVRPPHGDRGRSGHALGGLDLGNVLLRLLRVRPLEDLSSPQKEGGSADPAAPRNSSADDDDEDDDDDNDGGSSASEGKKGALRTSSSFSTYWVYASSADVPSTLFHASLHNTTNDQPGLSALDVMSPTTDDHRIATHHFALPTKSSMPGLEVLTSPTVAVPLGVINPGD